MSVEMPEWIFEHALYPGAQCFGIFDYPVPTGRQPGSDFKRKGMMRDGAESVSVVLFIIRHYGVIERLPGMGWAE